MASRVTNRLAAPAGRGLVLVALAALLLARPAASGTSRSAATTHVTVIAAKPTEFRFSLSRHWVPLGAVVFAVTNRGTLAHNLKICMTPLQKGVPNACKGKGTPLLAPGQSAKLAVSFSAAGRYEYICTVAGHAVAGMKGVLTVRAILPLKNRLATR